MQSQINFPIRKRIRKNGDKENLENEYNCHLSEEEKTLFRYSILQKCKLAFTTSSRDVNIIGREKEICQAKTFLNSKIQLKQSGLLYICGPPGTGKTLSMNNILLNIKKNANYLSINCISIPKPNDVYLKITNWLQESKLGRKKSIKKIPSHAIKDMNVIIMDEIDHINLKNNEVLLKIFQLVSDPKLKIIIIGISNTLNMIENMLPKLKKLSISFPHVIEFLPYNSNEILNILCKRMEQVGCSENEVLFEPSALEICAKKVAALTGDIRIALDVCRKSLESRDSHDNSVFQNKTNFVSSHKEAQKISAIEICKILPHQNNFNHCLPLLSINQKFIIASLIQLFKKTPLKFLLVNKAYQNYMDNCKKYNFNSIPLQDFLTSCEIIEDQKLLKIINQNLVKKIHASLPINELEILLRDDGILSIMMQTF